MTFSQFLWVHVFQKIFNILIPLYNSKYSIIGQLWVQKGKCWLWNNRIKYNTAISIYNTIKTIFCHDEIYGLFSNCFICYFYSLKWQRHYFPTAALNVKALKRAGVLLANDFFLKTDMSGLFNGTSQPPFQSHRRTTVSYPPHIFPYPCLCLSS